MASCATPGTAVRHYPSGVRRAPTADGGSAAHTATGSSPLRAAAAVVVVALLAAGLTCYLAIRHHDQLQAALLRPSGIPGSVPTRLADLMQLSPVPAMPAPSFSLTDQHGQPVSLASLRGRAVVLEFMDPHCTDICPIVSAEFIDAYRDLGKAASRAVFIAVNVNPYYRTVAEMAAYTREHQLDTIPSWHFLTGSLTSLRAVWRAYDILVAAPSRTADVIHTSEIFFISPRGTERYIAAPMDDHTTTGAAYLPTGQLTAWGRGIALVTRQLAD
jgi:cytochrome oxidase Cu insertion factor (SCO1/SenC/PrrC family)